MKCDVCPNEISAARLEASPNTKTCCKACSVKRQKRLRNEIASDHYHRKKAQEQTKDA